MLEDVRAFEFYYDSGQDEPKEDPARIHERLETIAEREGVAYERIDTADMAGGERREFYGETASGIRADREYHVGNRIFTGSTFGSLRPVLVIRYTDGDGIDVYPHRNDAVGARPVGILDFLDEVGAGTESDRGDYAAVRNDASGSMEGSGGDSDSAEGEAGTRPGRSTVLEGVVARLKSHLPL